MWLSVGRKMEVPLTQSSGHVTQHTKEDVLSWESLTWTEEWNLGKS